MRKKFTCVGGVAKSEQDHRSENTVEQTEAPNVRALEHPPVHHQPGQLRHPWMRNRRRPQNPSPVN